VQTGAHSAFVAPLNTLRLLSFFLLIRLEFFGIRQSIRNSIHTFNLSQAKRGWHFTQQGEGMVFFSMETNEELYTAIGLNVELARAGL
jgi:hypothetical protein